MSSEAISTFGTLLKIGDGEDPEVFANVAEVRDSAGLSLTNTTQETTHHESPDGMREYIGTLGDAGEPTFELNWLAADTTHALLLTKQKSRAVVNFQIVFPDGYGFEFAAIVTNLTFPSPVDGVRRASLTLRTTGALTDIEPA